MELQAKKFALAVALSIGVVYLICTLITVLSPEFAVFLAGSLFHMVDLKDAVNVQVTGVGALIGLIQIILLGYIGGWFIAWFHNRFLKSAR